jgi:hypothetical protein
VRTWRGAARHFVVRLPASEARRRLQAKLAWLPPHERTYWEGVWRRSGPDLPPPDTLEFLALSLDSVGRPITVMHSDPALRLLLQDLPTDEARRALAPFTMPYPVGLRVEGLGPLVANDAYAAQAVWEPWRTDLYHSPRVVWGREVNILLMALARLPRDTLFGRVLRETRAAVTKAGLEEAELWTYRIDGSGARLVPMRYGSSSDVQLWNLTDLAVEFVLAGDAARR